MTVVGSTGSLNSMKMRASGEARVSPFCGLDAAMVGLVVSTCVLSPVVKLAAFFTPRVLAVSLSGQSACRPDKASMVCSVLALRLPCGFSTTDLPITRGLPSSSATWLTPFSKRTWAATLAGSILALKVIRTLLFSATSLAPSAGTNSVTAKVLLEDAQNCACSVWSRVGS